MYIRRLFWIVVFSCIFGIRSDCFADVIDRYTVEEMCERADVIAEGTHLGKNRVRLCKVYKSSPLLESKTGIINVQRLSEHNKSIFGGVTPIHAEKLILFLVYKKTAKTWHSIATTNQEGKCGSSGLYWIDDNTCYGYMQTEIPGPLVLVCYSLLKSHPCWIPVSTKALKTDIRLGLENVKEWKQTLAIEDPAKKAKALAAYLLKSTSPKGYKGMYRNRIRSNLAELGKHAVPEIIQALRNAPADEKLNNAVLTLRNIGRPAAKAIPELRALLAKPKCASTGYVLLALASTGDTRVIPDIAKYKTSKNNRLAEDAAKALEQLRKRRLKNLEKGAGRNKRPLKIQRQENSLVLGPWTIWPCPTCITAMCTTKAGLWCGTRGGLFYYDFESGSYHWWNVFNGLSSNHIRSVCEINGTVWVSSGDRFFRKNNEKWSQVYTQDGLEIRKVRNAISGPEGNLWISAFVDQTSGVKIYDFSNWHLYKKDIVYYLSFNPSGHVLGCDFNILKGVTARWNPGSALDWKPVKLKRISTDQVGLNRDWSAICGTVCARTSKTWLILNSPSIPGPKGKSVIVYDRERQEIINIKGETKTVLAPVPEHARPKQQAFRELVMARVGKDILMGGRTGLWRLSHTGARKLSPSTFSNPQEVRHLHELDGGELLIHSYYNIFIRFLPRDDLIKPFTGIPNTGSDFSFPHIDLRRAVVRRWEKGKIKNQKIRFAWSNERNRRLNDGCFSFLISDCNGKEWFWGYKGVGFLREGIFTLVFSSDRWRGIRDVCTAEEKIFLATRKGLVKLDTISGKAWVIAAKDKTIYSVHFAEGMIWFGTEYHGFYSYRIEDKKETQLQVPWTDKNIIRDIDNRGRSLFLGTDNGIFEFETETHGWRRWTSEYANAVLIDKSGNLWIGSRSGVMRYEFKKEYMPRTRQECRAAAERLVSDFGKSGPVRDRSRKKLIEMGETARQMLLENRGNGESVKDIEVRFLLEELCDPVNCVFAQDQRRFCPPPLSGHISNSIQY